MLHNKRILLGITGGIAAYKTLELIRCLRQDGAVVKVILTSAGKEFVTPLSIQALSGEKVYSELLSADNEAAMSHIELARWAEVLLIAPATANFMAKFKYGIADDLLSAVCLATTAPVLIAPAMNQQMWQHTATQDNLQALQQRGVQILGPASGSQACGEIGPGRMLEAHELHAHLQNLFASQSLTGKHVLITAGPTQEEIDPVRFISNHSSGKMGYALAQAAVKLGAQVTLISGPCNLPRPSQVNFVAVISAQEMHAAVMTCINTVQPKVDILLACAAVADYQPIITQQHKIKKSDQTINLQLQRTQDILATVAQLPVALRPMCVGFAAETEDLVANANAKLQNKNLDFVIANSVADRKVFGQDENEVVIIGKDKQIKHLTKMRKELLAFEILKAL